MAGRRYSWLLATAALTAPLPALAAGAASSAAGASAARSSSGGNFEPRLGVPDGFEELSGPRQLLVDLYMGGRRIGEVRITSEDGQIRFDDPAAAALLIKHASDPTELTAALSMDFPANAGRVCSTVASTACGTLNPELAGVIFNDERFRLDLFLAPRLLSAVSAVAQGYLDTPESGLSLASSFGASLSGSSQSGQAYQLQARNLLGFRNGRLRNNTVFASGQGLLVDDLVAELDRPGWRYSAGLFWAPGSDFTGQRRMLGVGIGTQLETRIDRDSLDGTPLLLFLRQPARVEVLVDGQLVASRFYEAGNNILDSAGLPSGSYPLVLRIHEGSGPPREERRFFVRSSQMAPVGHPIYYAYAGMMADRRKGRPVSLTGDYYLRAGTARRFSRDLGVEAAVTATPGKTLAEVGVFLATPIARIRALGLASSDGDFGAMAQITSANLGRLNFGLDLRHIRSADGKPLIPLPQSAEGFSATTASRVDPDSDSYTQLTGTMAYHLGPATVQLLAFYRAERAGRADYSLGPSLNWRLLQLPGLQLNFNADVQKTRETLSGFVGMRMLINRGGFSVSSQSGGAYRGAGANGRGKSGAVTQVSTQWYRQAGDRSEVSIAATLDRTLDGMSAQGTGSFASPFGTARGDVLHRFGGGGSTDYVLNLQSGGALTAGAFELGGRDLDESAIIAKVEGSGGPFELLVDDVAKGQVSGGQALALFLRPYRSYQVRLRDLGSGASAYDSGTRAVTLYPGNVVRAVWRAEPVVTLFGRALDDAGRPIADASVETKRGSGRSDAEGWFQVEAAVGEPLRLTRRDGGQCNIVPGVIDAPDHYAPLGDVTCR